MVQKPSVVFLDAATVGIDLTTSGLLSFGKYTQYDFTGPSETVSRIADNEIVITNKVIIDKNVMDNCPSMKLICVAATGMNNIDLEYASLKGLQVKNVSGYSTESVVQSTFSMLFYLMNNVSYYDQYVKSGEYSRSKIFTHHGREFSEISGKTFGIIGMGTIGKRVAEVAKVFGADVVYFSTSGKNRSAGYEHVELDNLLRTADFVSIHCPLNESTKDLLSINKLLLMKPTAYLLNLGRGGVINEKDLAKALDEGLIAGAALDVLTKEPVSTDNPLLHISNSHKLLITPHIAWASRESRARLIEKIEENIREYLGLRYK